MHGHRQTKLLARYVLHGPVAIHSSPALRTPASLLRTAFFDPGQSPYILTRLIRTLKSFFCKRQYENRRDYNEIIRDVNIQA